MTADGHGYTGEFTAKEFNERAFDHDKTARNGLSAGPNVSYVRTFQACAAALRYAAKHMFTATPDDNATWNAAIEAAAKLVEAYPEYMRIADRISAATAIRALKR